ncbi:cytochrome c oxidase subunit 6C-1-like isoform X2 [Oncorhynchus keta]|uniref:cytochrome c oxidase subunit 6C-1-like isoform X2 n=1 Tax=Oncorhynchus keta TaxID=8018 RepID=UPI00227C80AC|nr:cytochrome c oxidase subunit 6C-1-like isoform X2 [Oncorhynchus keta]
MPDLIFTSQQSHYNQLKCDLKNSTMSLAKPAMRGLLGKRLRFHLPIAFALSLVAAAAFKYGVTEPRKRAYADFYKQYDTTKEFNNMRDAGVFESVRPTGK